jgi:hypothetical protein
MEIAGPLEMGRTESTIYNQEVQLPPIYRGKIFEQCGHFQMKVHWSVAYQRQKNSSV